MIVKELSIRVRREGRFHAATTLVYSFIMILSVMILGMIINDHVRKVKLCEDIYFPETNAYTYSLSASSSYLYPRSTNGTLDQFGKRITRVTWHSMHDDELFWRAKMVSPVVDYTDKETPRVAFLFLTRGKLPLAPLWEMFFKGHEGFFSIYLHTSPDFTYEPPESSVFYKRRVPSKEVDWGKASMIDAERRLLANALLDSNERFVLLSETCIPIFNFTTIYNYLINSKQSFVGCFDDPSRIGRGRYSKKMSPAISLSDWRKGSQWFEVNRKLATEIVSDGTYYPIFKNHCMPPCYMDEHYLPTLATKINPQLISNRTITWTDWSGGGSHPTRFMRKDISEGFLNHIRFGFKCTYNGVPSSVCFLFARKFHPSTLQPLLQITPTLFGFDPWL